MSEALVWTNGTRRLSELIPWGDNPAEINAAEAKRLLESLDEFGQVKTIAIEPDNSICDGHQRKSVWAAAQKYGPDFEVDVRIASRKLTRKEREKLAVLLRTAQGHFNWDTLAGYDAAELQAWGLDAQTLSVWGEQYGELDVMLEAAADEKDLPEITEGIRPKEMARVLVSVPVDFAADVRLILAQLEDVEGIEIIYGAN